MSSSSSSLQQESNNDGNNNKDDLLNHNNNINDNNIDTNTNTTSASSTSSSIIDNNDDDNLHTKNNTKTFYTNFENGCKYLSMLSSTSLSYMDTTTTTSTTTTTTSSTSSNSNSGQQQQQQDSSAAASTVTLVPSFVSEVIVNFIDPTTSSIMMSSSSASSSNNNNNSNSSNNNNLGYNAAMKRAKLQQHIQLYEKFINIFQQQYQNQLYNISYHLFRNHMITGTIPILPIRTIVSRGHGGGFIVSSSTNDNTTTTNMIQQQMNIYGDYSWEQPYCYVYLAACENIDHYRTKVKPSIQVFISQLEAAMNKIMKSSSSSSTSSTSLTSRFRRARSSNDSNNNNNTDLDESLNGGGMDTSISGTTTTTSGGGNMQLSPNKKNTSNSNNNNTKRTTITTVQPRYVIIYIPTGSSSGSTDTATTTSSSGGGGGGNTEVVSTTTSFIEANNNNTSASTTTTTTTTTTSVASRFAAAARQRMASVTVGRTTISEMTSTISTTTESSTIATTSTTTNDDGTTIDTDDLIGSGGQQQQSATTVPPSSLPPAIQQLNRMEREIARRFANDFPNGNVCTLSTLFDTTFTSNSDNEKGNSNMDNESKATAATAPAQPVVENIVQQLEWQAILKAMGNAIMSNFHDRCQRYDDEIRMIDHKRRSVDTTTTTTPTKSNPVDASSTTTPAIDDYHLCHFVLVKENLALTYEQMRLPSESLLQYEELRAYIPERNDTTSISTTDVTTSKNRELLIELALRGDILEFRRHLKMYGDTPTIQYVAEEYLFAREIALLFQMNQPVRIIQRCYTYVKSAFQIKQREIDDMDISKESRQKLIDLYQWAFCFCWYIKKGGDNYLLNTSKSKTSDQIAFARCMCDVLEFARYCLECVGDIVLSQSDIPRPYGQGLMQSLEKAWTPWKEPAIQTIVDNKPTTEFSTPEDFLNNALTSFDAFTDRYSDILNLLALCHEYCDRRRFAARLRIERLDIMDSKDEKVNAAKEILHIFNVYKSDQWNACHFALLLRLAHIQRHISPPMEYMRTLVRCFYNGITAIASQKALEALHNDLLAVIQCPSVKDSKFSAASLFGPTFSLEGLTSSILQGNDRSLLKKLYTVGDVVRINLLLKSFLPKEIEVDTISINLVPFPKYVSAMEDHVLITNEDIYHVIKLQRITISPGPNDFIGEWLPINSGQFIIASVAFVWNGVIFTYTAKEIRRPTIRIDVVPCVETQTLEVTPKHLVVGLKQPIQVDVVANRDFIVGGTLTLSGPSNVSFCREDVEVEPDKWVQSLDMTLPSCEPSNKISVRAIANVTSSADSKTTVDYVEVNATTSFKFASKDNTELATDIQQAVINERIDLIGKNTFSVQSCHIVPYSIETSILNAVLCCNSASNLTIKTWSIDLPPCYVLSNNIDLNDSLTDEIITCGDRISFSFDCTHVSSATNENISHSILHITLEDEVGLAFHESIKLRMKSNATWALKVVGVNPVLVTISTSQLESFVGCPIELTYTINSNDIAKLPTNVSFQIADDHADWIIGGRNIGGIDVAAGGGFNITIIAIPIRPGPIHEYPALSLKCSNDTGNTTIPTSVKSSGTFTCLSPSVHTSIAFELKQ